MDIEEDIQYLKDLIKLAKILPNGECTIQDREKEAITNVLAEYKRLKSENTMLENTKNMCPILRTSGTSCGIKDKVKELGIEREVTDE